MATLNWTEQAIEDLVSIAEYISRDSVKYARRQVSIIRQRTKLITSHPNIGRVVPELDNPAVRELIEGNYRIIYRVVSTKRIDILTIHHSARLLRLRTE